MWHIWAIPFMIILLFYLCHASLLDIGLHFVTYEIEHAMCLSLLYVLLPTAFITGYKLG